MATCIIKIKLEYLKKKDTGKEKKATPPPHTHTLLALLLSAVGLQAFFLKTSVSNVRV